MENPAPASEPHAAEPASTSIRAYSSTEIAAALRCSPKTVLRNLISVAPRRAARGARSWSLDSLPAEVRERLQTEALRQGFEDSHGLLAFERKNLSWNPTVPIAQCAESAIQDADRLRRAMSRVMERKDAAGISAAELEAMGCQDYNREFGREHPISPRHWRRLFRRTLDRAGTRWPLASIEIYLSDRPARRTITVEAAIPEPAVVEGFVNLQEIIGSWAVSAYPTDAEWALMWNEACIWCREQTEAGRSQKAVREELIGFLWDRLECRFPSREAVRKTLARKFKSWEKTETIASLRDRRAEANARRAKAVDEDFELQIVWKAVRKYRGRLAPALREVSATQIGGRKSYVPKSMRDRLAPKIGALMPFQQGPRAADKATLPMELSYDGIMSMDALTIDDVTLNSYFWIENPDGSFGLTRGQLILICDFRSLRVLHYGMIPDEQPNSLLAWGVTMRAIQEFGIPKALQVERGKVFRESKLMTGGKAAIQNQLRGGWEDVPMAERELGLQSLGIRIITARRARSKPVERVIGLLQDRMDGEQGFAGRNERMDRPESTAEMLKQCARTQEEVSGGKPHPSRFFHGFIEWEKRVEEIVEGYNRTHQEGRRLSGLSPDEAFLKHWPNDDPPTRLDRNSTHLLAYHRKPLVVRNGSVTFALPGSGERCRYTHDRLIQLEGQTLVAWLDPENPELLTLTDTKYRNPITVERDRNPNALVALLGGEDVLEAETAKRQRQRRHWKALHRTLKARFEVPFRSVIASQTVAQTAEKIASQRSKASQDRDDRVKRTVSGRRAFQRLDLSPATVSPSVDIAEAGTELERAMRLAEERERAMEGDS